MDKGRWFAVKETHLGLDQSELKQEAIAMYWCCAILLYWTAIGPTRSSMPTAKHAVAWTKMDWLTKLKCFGFVACGEWNQSQAKLNHSNTSACTSAPATLLRPSHPFRDLTRPGAKTLRTVRCCWSMSQFHLTHLLGNAVAPLLFDLQPTSKGKAKSWMTSNCTWTMGGWVREKSSTNSGCWTSDIDVKSDCSYMNLSSKPDFNHKQLKSHHPRSLTVLFRQGPNSGWPWCHMCEQALKFTKPSHILLCIPTLQSFRCVPAKSARALWLWCQWFQQGCSFLLTAIEVRTGHKRWWIHLWNFVNAYLACVNLRLSCGHVSTLLVSRNIVTSLCSKEVVFFRSFRFLWTAHSGVQQLIICSSTRLRNLWRHPIHLRVPGCCQLRLSASTRAEQTQQDHPHRQSDSS